MFLEIGKDFLRLKTLLISMDFLEIRTIEALTTCSQLVNTFIKNKNIEKSFLIFAQENIRRKKVSCKRDMLYGMTVVYSDMVELKSSQARHGRTLTIEG